MMRCPFDPQATASATDPKITNPARTAAIVLMDRLDGIISPPSAPKPAPTLSRWAAPLSTLRTDPSPSERRVRSGKRHVGRRRRIMATNALLDAARDSADNQRHERHAVTS